MTPLRQRRLIVAVVVVVGAATTLALAVTALQQNLEFFYLPDKVVAGEVPTGKRVRAGGLVADGSIKRNETDLQVQFILRDLDGASFPVEYTGLLPNLFKEGQGAIVSGVLDESGVFQADQVLAKHDENYMPPEVAHLISKSE